MFNGLSRLTKKDLLQRVKNAGIGSEVHATEVLGIVDQVLHEMFDDSLVNEIRPLFFRNGTVTLESTSSIIAQEVRTQEKTVADNINKRLGKVYVKHFLWRIGV
jgi:hypothetical protein